MSIESVMPSNHLILCHLLLLLPSIFPSIRIFSNESVLRIRWPSGGQSIGVSASTSVLPMNTQDWSPWGWTGWISLQSKGLSREEVKRLIQNHTSLKSWTRVRWCVWDVFTLAHPASLCDHWHHRSHDCQHHWCVSGEGRLGHLPRPGLGPALEMPKFNRREGKKQQELVSLHPVAIKAFASPPYPPPAPAFRPPRAGQVSRKCRGWSLHGLFPLCLISLSARDLLFLHFWGYESASYMKLCQATVFILLYGTVYLFSLLPTRWLP